MDLFSDPDDFQPTQTGPQTQTQSQSHSQSLPSTVIDYCSSPASLAPQRLAWLNPVVLFKGATLLPMSRATSSQATNGTQQGLIKLYNSKRVYKVGRHHACDIQFDESRISTYFWCMQSYSA